MDSIEIRKLLEQAGWYRVRQKGSHVQYRHASRKGLVTLPHPKKNLPVKTIRSIENQSGVALVPRTKKKRKSSSKE